MQYNLTFHIEDCIFNNNSILMQNMDEKHYLSRILVDTREDDYLSYYNLSDSIPRKEGFIFLGWYSEGSQQYYYNNGKGKKNPNLWNFNEDGSPYLPDYGSNASVGIHLYPKWIEYQPDVKIYIPKIKVNGKWKEYDPYVFSGTKKQKTVAFLK